MPEALNSECPNPEAERPTCSIENGPSAAEPADSDLAMAAPAEKVQAVCVGRAAEELCDETAFAAIGGSNGPSKITVCWQPPESEATSKRSLGLASEDVAFTPGRDRSAEQDLFVKFISRMAATRPEIIRGIRPRHALAGWGQALRGRAGQLHKYSKATARIDEFWSHSWHSSAWMKYSTLLLLSSSLVATVVGMICALLALSLRVYGVLPATRAAGFVDSHWCLLLGMAGYYLTLLVWRPRRLVFLDLLCIDQEDENLQGEALLCMGAILKSSTSMRVLWDATWSSRLWCIFELAGFLHSRDASLHHKLEIRPTLTGPMLITGNLSVCLMLLIFPEALQWSGTFHGGFMMVVLTLGSCGIFCNMGLAHVGRALCRDLASMQHQLAQFSIHQTRCYCCDARHLDISGGPLACDRQVLTRCIGVWFGSTDNFELYVRGKVRSALLGKLTSPVLLYRLVVEAGCPVMWFFLDRLAYALTRSFVDHYPLWPVSVVLEGLAWWLTAIPTILFLGTALAYKLRAKPKRMLTDLFMSLMVVLAGTLLLVGFFSLETLCVSVIPSQHPALLPAKAVFFVLMMLMTSFAQCMYARARRSALSI